MDKNPYKNIKDIIDDVEKFEDRISTNRDEVKSEIDSLNIILDDSVKNAGDQIDIIISELNSKNIKNQDKYNRNIESASNYLEDSIRLFKDDISKVKSTYHKSLIILFASFSILLLIYIIFFNIYPKIDLYLISIIQILIIGVMFFSLFYIFRNLNMTTKLDLIELSKNKSSFKKTENTLVESNIPIQKFTPAKSYINSTKDVLNTFVLVAGETVPLIKRVYDETNLHVKYQQLVSRFIAAMEFYNLPKDVEYFNQITKQVTADIRLMNDENSWKQSIAGKISKKSKQEGIEASEDIILLLYNEHNGSNTKSLFRNIKNSDSELKSLSGILIYSKQLVEMPKLVKYNHNDIIALLKSIDDFDVSKINKKLLESIRLLDYLHTYVEFLKRNEINVNFNPDIAFTITETDKTDDDFEKQVITLSYKIGKKVLSDYNLGEFLDGFVRVSLSFKFHNEISLSEISCKCSGNNESTAIIKEYYDKNKQSNRQNIVNLKELIDNIDSIKQNIKNVNDKDFKHLKIQLQEGKLFDNSVALMIDLFDKQTQELKDKISELDNYKIFAQVAKEMFSKVELGTVDKAIDSQIFGAYLIMAKSDKGKLLDLVDVLSKRDSGNNKREKRWELKTREHINQIYNDYKVSPNYDFITFSSSTRIGILYKGQSFIEFKKCFLDDMDKILLKTKDTLESGLIIQRISPSKYSFGILGDEHLPDNISIKNLDIAEYVTRLASDYATIEEQMVISGLEKNINLFEIINTKKISELIRHKNKDLKTIEIETLDSTEFKQKIMEGIKELGVNSIPSLSLDLYNNVIKKKKVSLVFERVIQQQYSNTKGLKKDAKNRSKILSKRFSSVLEGLGSIYEWYSN